MLNVMFATAMSIAPALGGNTSPVGPELGAIAASSSNCSALASARLRTAAAEELAWGDELPSDFRFNSYLGGPEVTRASCKGKSVVIVFVSHAQNAAYIRRTLEATETIAQRFAKSSVQVVAVYVPFDDSSLTEAYEGPMPSFTMPVCQMSGRELKNTWGMTGTPGMVIADPKGIVRKIQIGWSGGSASDANQYSNIATPYLKDFANGLYEPNISVAVKRLDTLSALFGKYTGKLELEDAVVNEIAIERCNEKDHLLISIMTGEDSGMMLGLACDFSERNPSYYSSDDYIKSEEWGAVRMDDDWKPVYPMTLSLYSAGKRLRLERLAGDALLVAHTFELSGTSLKVSLFESEFEEPSRGTLKKVPGGASASPQQRR